MHYTGGSTASTRLVAAILALLCTVSAPACGRAPTSKRPVVASSTTPTQPPQTLSIPDAPPTLGSVASEYAALAADLADPFLRDPDAPRQHVEFSQLLAQATTRVVRLQSIRSTDPLISRIAKEAASAGEQMIQSREALDLMARQGSFTNLIVGGLGLYVGDATMVVNAAVDALRTAEAEHTQRAFWASAFDRARSAQLMLPDAARMLAGRSTSSELVRVDIDESFAGSADHDKVALTNVSGQALSHCTVRIELLGRDGDVRQNVHYVEQWAPGETLHARYGIGTIFDGRWLGRRTVYGLQRATVAVWSDHASREGLVYEYAGRERDADVERALKDKLALAAWYEPSGLLRSTSAVWLQLEGVAQIPPHRLSIAVFPCGAVIDSPVEGSWDGREWSMHEQRMFDFGKRLSFQPGSVDVRIEFPGIAFKPQISIPLALPAER